MYGTEFHKERIRALSLLSGGLDSQLAVCILREQGIDVHGVCFESPFFSTEAARSAAQKLAIPLRTVNFSADIIRLLGKAKHGFGSCMNPCIDCHAAMLKRAGQLMEDEQFHFLSTGEVLNERPMSQTRRSLDTVAEESGYADRIVRPLSAGLLPVTKPESLGWVDRSRLLSIEGRSRRVQFQLAERFGLHDFPTPAGGCRLTEPNFCRRLKDLQDHEGLDGTKSVYLLRFGRHFRLDQKVKLIVGRNEDENVILEGTADLYDFILKVENVPGPTGLLPLTAGEEQIRAGAAICARYSDGKPGEPVTIRMRSSREVRRLEVLPLDDQQVDALKV